MAYKIPSDLFARVQAQVATGQFSNEEEVLREALDALEKRQRGLKELQAMVKEAEADIAAGKVGPFEIDQTMARVRERLEQQSSSS